VSAAHSAISTELPAEIHLPGDPDRLRVIIRLHGGTIRLAANHPAGTTVSVRLPLTP
jgi:hypothetical protein